MLIQDLDAVLRMQYGLFTRSGGLELLGAERFRSLVRRGQLVRVHRNVYRARGVVLDYRAEALAAVLSFEGAVASHTTALMLHGLRIEASLPHVTIQQGVGRSSAMIVHRTALSPSERTSVDGVPCTSLSRSFVDSASVLTANQLSKALNEAVVQQLVTYDKVNSCLRNLGTQGRGGAAVLLTILQEHLPLDGVRSPEEVRALLALKGFPDAQLQYEIELEGTTYWLDAAWPDHKVAVEVDGFGAHGTSRKRFDHDRRRNNRLLAAGWRVLHITSSMTKTEIRRQLLALLRSPA